MAFEYLFSPIKINEMEVSNRIVMTAMHLGYTPDGEVTDRLIDFYIPRAEGGAGLIIVGGCPVDEYAGMSSMICLHEDRFIPGLRRLADAVKSRGARIAAQLYQAGRYTHSSFIGGRKPFSASAVRSKLTGETPRSLELQEIPVVQDKFAEAAIRARKAGFDAVEILGSAGYLISQFLSPITNKREDKYGGSFENRMRFGIEVVEKVRAAVGRGFPILVRIAGNEFMQGGNTNREARRFAVELERVGADLFNVTGGWHETRVPQLTSFVPRGGYVYLSQGIKSSVSVPVLASNRINDPSLGEAILRNGQADLVTMARGLLADPDLPKKARNGQSHLIYHCVACNQGCFDNIFRYQPATCLVNPRAGKEREFVWKSAPRPKKVLVIGGGPAGMKAACTAAERGHRVTLVEREQALGGQILLNRAIPGRGELVTVAQDLENHLVHLGVEVLRGRTADGSLIQDLAPDTVVLATGARPVLPDIPGSGGENVVQAWEVLAGKTAVGDRVVIIGGNAVGLETALYLANIGTLSPEVLHFLMVNRAETVETLEACLDTGQKKITVVEMLKRVGQDIGLSTRWTVMSEIRRLGVTLKTSMKAVAITPDGVEVETEENRDLLPADSVVLAVGSVSVNSFPDAVRALVPEMHVIGDAREPRKALDAIFEGYRVGLEI